MRVMLATPTLARQPTIEYMMSVMKAKDLLMTYGHTLDLCFVGGDAFVMKARNGLVQSFIESWKSEYPADVLVMIDDDQAFDEVAFLHIVQDSHEFIGVAIPKKMDSDPLTFNNVSLELDAEGNCLIENGFMKCNQVGSGFIALKRSAIEKMVAAYPQRYAPGDGGVHPLHYNLFESKIIWDEKDPMVIGQFWGEDLIFCKKWCALGESIWIQPNVTVEHVGRKSWPGNFMEFLQKHAKVELAPVVQLQPVAQKTPEPIPETLDALARLAA